MIARIFLFSVTPKQEFRTGLTAPTSHGALPIGCSRQNELLVPLAEGEALWIGLRSLDPDYAVSIKATFGLRRGDVPTKRNPSVEIEVPADSLSLAIIWRVDTAAETQSPIVFRSRHGNDQCESISPCVHGETTTI
jgi:hypothetical protein